MAFPVGIGLALIVGVVLSYLLQPAGNPLFIFGGVALVAVAIVLDALAYRRREIRGEISTRGVVLSIVSGLLMGSFFPFVARFHHWCECSWPLCSGVCVCYRRWALLSTSQRVAYAALPHG